MSQKTELYAEHLAVGGKMVDFAGWQMPIHYGSQLDEHHSVRQDAGVFDVSHMTIVEIQGENSQAYLRYLLANDVAKLALPGKALYSCMLNEQGGIIDDLIVYFISPNHYRLVVNASTREKDLAWMLNQAKPFRVNISPRTDLAILAIQGPNACQRVNALLPSQPLANLTSFQFLVAADWLIARTGYTGEEGYEIMLPNTEVVDFWQKLLAAGIKPCGLGARDTLRLEAGLNLYGLDMDETTTPLESNLGWTVAFAPEDRNFMGRAALEKSQSAGVTQKLVGLLLAERGVLRPQQRVLAGDGKQGEITSGTFSPSLNKGIALARVPATMADTCQVEIRGKLVTAHVVKPPFIKNGKPSSAINLILTK